MKKEYEIPDNIADKIHYYGIIETPSDLIGFYCGAYEIKETTITVIDLLLDTSVTRKSYIMRVGKIFFEKLEFINYMAMFFPYVPYKHREDKLQIQSLPPTRLETVRVGKADPEGLREKGTAPNTKILADAIRNTEKRRIEDTLKQTNWHKVQSAKLLGIDRTTLWRKIKTYNIKK